MLIKQIEKITIGGTEYIPAGRAALVFANDDAGLDLVVEHMKANVSLVVSETEV